jgi:hypothetical protein
MYGTFLSLEMRPENFVLLNMGFPDYYVFYGLLAVSFLTKTV